MINGICPGIKIKKWRPPRGRGRGTREENGRGRGGGHGRRVLDQKTEAGRGDGRGGRFGSCLRWRAALLRGGRSSMFVAQMPSAQHLSTCTSELPLL